MQRLDWVRKSISKVASLMRLLTQLISLTMLKCQRLQICVLILTCKQASATSAHKMLPEKALGFQPRIQRKLNIQLCHFHPPGLCADKQQRGLIVAPGSFLFAGQWPAGLSSLLHLYSPQRFSTFNPSQETGEHSALLWETKKSHHTKCLPTSSLSSYISKKIKGTCYPLSGQCVLSKGMLSIQSHTKVAIQLSRAG